MMYSQCRQLSTYQMYTSSQNLIRIHGSCFLIDYYLYYEEEEKCTKLMYFLVLLFHTFLACSTALRSLIATQMKAGTQLSSQGMTESRNSKNKFENFRPNLDSNRRQAYNASVLHARLDQTNIANRLVPTIYYCIFIYFMQKNPHQYIKIMNSYNEIHCQNFRERTRQLPILTRECTQTAIISSHFTEEVQIFLFIYSLTHIV